MPRALDDTLYYLSLDVLERGRTDAAFIRKRLSCSDINAKKYLKKMQDLGIIGDYKFEVLGNGYEALLTVSEYKKRFISDWEAKGYPRGV